MATGKELRAADRLARAVSEALESRLLLDGSWDLPRTNPDVNNAPFAPVRVQPSLRADLMRLGEQLGLPNSFSLRPSLVTPVKDQGNCGSCWTFSAMATLEGSLLKAGGPAVDLSENNLKNYHGFDWGPCDGGNTTISQAYFARGAGPVLESQDPYHDYDDRLTPAPTLDRAYWVTQMLRFDTHGEIKSALMNYGAVETNMRWETTAFRSSDNTYHYSGSLPSDHAVTIVGWDDSKVTAAATPGAWLVRNSWGSSWGDNGYFWASYDDAILGRAGVWYGGAVAPSTYDDVYYWDTHGNVSEMSAGSAMNKFVAGRNEVLRSVGFYTLADMATYTITVYDTFDGTTPASILSMCAGSFEFAGYHVAQLPIPVTLAAGNDYFVRVTLGNGGTYAYAMDKAEPGFSSAVTALPGQSYYLNGSTWQDLTSYDSTANFSIKAYTTRVTATGVDVLGSILSIGNANVYGGRANLDFAIRNAGSQAAGAFSVRFFLSEDSTIDPLTDTPLQLATADPRYNALTPFDYRVSGVAADGLEFGSVQLALSAADPFMTSGSYYIGMVVDAGNEIAENTAGGETNNWNQGTGIDRVAVEYLETVYAADMNTNPGWTLTGSWGYGRPQNVGPSAGFTGLNVIGYNLTGNYSNSMGALPATTPAINLSGIVGAKLSFYRYLGVESDTWDHASVQVSNDNANWTTLWSNGAGTINDSQWLYQEFDISAIADGSSTTYVRWVMGPTDTTVVYPGWYIDDVKITGRRLGPTDLELLGDSVAEAQPVGTLVGQVRGIHNRPGATFTYALVQTLDSALFRIEGDQLLTNGLINYEYKSTHSIRVRATDDRGYSVEKVLSIRVLDVNEPPYNLILSANRILENAAIGTIVGKFTGTDPDAGTVLSYALVPGDGATDNAQFELLGRDLKIKVVPDYESKSSYSIRVGVTDQHGLSYEKVFSIIVSNLDEAPVAVNDTVALAGRDRLVINVLANDTEPEGLALTLVSATTPTNGTVAVNADGTVTYFPALGFVGQDTFTYTVRDPGVKSAVGTVTVNVSIPSLANVTFGGTNNPDTITATVVGGILRLALNGEVRQFVYSAITSLTILGQGGNDLIDVDASVTRGVTISGGLGNDTLLGGSGNDWILGCNGDDTLDGRGGNDSVDGGAGNDVLNGGDGNDWIAGMDGVDTIDGGAGNDTIYGGPMGDSILGGEGDDRIFGGAGNDTIHAGAGNDAAVGELDNDLIFGGDGNDSLRGNFGNDTLHGEAGADMLFGDRDDDEVRGGPGTDVVDGGPGNDLLYGDADRDRLVGADGNDTMYGGDADDTLFGGLGNDLMYGEAGKDSLVGGGGADTLYGGSGADTLRGEDGDDVFHAVDILADRIEGGPGMDTAYHDITDLLFSIETSVLN